MDHNVQKADLLIHISSVRKGRKIYFYLKDNEKYFQQLEIMLNIFLNGQDQTIDLIQAQVVYFSVLIFFKLQNAGKIAENLINANILNEKSVKIIQKAGKNGGSKEISTDEVQSWRGKYFYHGPVKICSFSSAMQQLQQSLENVRLSIEKLSSDKII